MDPIILKSGNNSGLSDIDIYKAIKSSLDSQSRGLKKVLLIPPDLSRVHSGAGKITAMYTEEKVSKSPLGVYNLHIIQTI